MAMAIHVRKMLVSEGPKYCYRDDLNRVPAVTLML